MNKTKTKHAIVIGAGIAGCSVAYALAEHGVKSTVLEANNTISNEASGNTIGVYYPRLTASPSPFSEFYQYAFLHTCDLLKQLGKNTGCKQTGALMLDFDKNMRIKNQGILKTSKWNKDVIHHLNQEQASSIAGVNVPVGGLFYPQAGYLAPKLFCKSLLDAYSDMISLKINHPAKSINYTTKTKTWSVTGNDNETITADIVIIASGRKLTDYIQSSWLPLKHVGGQVTALPQTEQSSKLKVVVAHKGYIPPAVDGIHYMGSTFHRLDKNPELLAETTKDNLENINVLSEQIPSLCTNKINTKEINGRAQIRTTTLDHLPIIGRVPILLDWQIEYKGLEKGKITENMISLDSSSYYPNLYVTGAFGSHGMTSAPFAGAMIAAEATGNPLKITKEVKYAVHAGRFITRALKRRVAINY